MKLLKSTVSVGILAMLLTVSVVGTVLATPFTVTAQLTGDPRAANPDGIIVDVTITGDTTSNFVTWLVDLNSPLHPDARLGQFAFNILTPFGTSYAFSGFNPAGWSITGLANNVQGSGSMDFNFLSADPPGSRNNVTNLQSLTFTMTNTTPGSFFTSSSFLGASCSASSDAALGCSQMGAHVQSLTAGASGFAIGDYTTVPEPGSVLLLGLGLFALGFMRKGRQTK